MPGDYMAIRPGVALGRVVSLQWSYALLAAPADGSFTEGGTAHFLTTGVRVRPFATLRPETEQLGGLYLDANLGYDRTGDLDRFGFDLGLGYGLQVADWFAVGPAVRYVQIVQSDDDPRVDPNDAQFFTLGLSFSFGPTYRKAQPEEQVPVAAQETAPPADHGTS
jgi:hypothetical protein